MNQKIKIGKFGQQLAGQFLQNRNYQILAENYYSRVGEIDIIAQKDEQIVFIEVKTRTTENFGTPEEAVDDKKRNKMYDTALKYLSENKVDHDNFRLDMIAIIIDQDNMKAQIRHHQNILE